MYTVAGLFVTGLLARVGEIARRACTGDAGVREAPFWWRSWPHAPFRLLSMTESKGGVMADASDWRAIFISGAVSLVGAVSLAFVNNYLTHQTELQKAKIEQAQKAEQAQFEQKKAEVGLRQAVCEATFAYLQDEKPNTNISEDQRSAVGAMVTQNLKACVRQDDGPTEPPASAATAKPEGS